ncbi:MAG: hypothetical protein IPJ85_05645 [Flavobacteriales bacterium]|nr:hypothetical protein [Flavobacteriales bacterium]
MLRIMGAAEEAPFVLHDALGRVLFLGIVEGGESTHRLPRGVQPGIAILTNGQEADAQRIRLLAH